MTNEDKFLISGLGDNTTLICYADGGADDGCQWFMPFVMGTTVLEFLKAMDDHMRTNHPKG
jgi:hypothetical protein